MAAAASPAIKSFIASSHVDHARQWNAASDHRFLREGLGGF
jgi:hypothetical protein